MKLRLYECATKNPITGRAYRGVYRQSINAVDGDADREASQVFDQYLELIDEWVEITDLEFGRRAIQVYGHMNPPQHLEIVEVTIGQTPASLATSEFLGYDVACATHISLLSEGLDIDTLPKELSEKDPLAMMLPLLQLIKQHFQPRLNENGLFAEYETASFFLDTMMALQKLRPGLWESEDCKFEVLSIWHVT